MRIHHHASSAVLTLVVALAGCSPASNSGPAPAAPNLSTPSEPASTAVSSSQKPPPSPQLSPSAAADTSPGERQPMNVILLVVDAMRWDMPWEGYPRDIAPNLSKLRDRSVRYERGYSISSFTSKSVAGMISGKFPSELHRTTPFFTRYHDSNEMMAEVLQSSGVRTLSAHAHMYLDKDSGLTQGFDEWKLVSGIQMDYNKDPYITSPQYTELITEMLSRPENTSGRFFAYFHYMDPHHVYNAHAEAPNFGPKPRDLYDQEIFFTDLWIQKFLDFVAAQPWASKTAIIVTGDHGEGFGEKIGGVKDYRVWKHAFEIYEVLVRVPLFVYIPGVEPRDVPRWRSHIDLVPTVYDLLGVQAPDGLFGKSLVPEIYGEVQPPRPIVLDLPADSHNRRRRAVIDEGFKTLAFGRDYRFTLFNVAEDPWETKDISKVDRERRDEMVKRYREVVSGIKDVDAKGGPPVMAD